MKKVFCLCMAILFAVSCSGAANADEISELKAQMAAMQEQMKAMQKKISQLETERTGNVPQGACEAPAATSDKKGDDLRVYWDKGIHLDSPDDNFKLKLGGRLFLDTSIMSEQSAVKDAFGGLDDNVEVRRARFYVSGDVYKDFVYKLQIDFATGDVEFRDAYIGMKNIPYLGQIRVGQYTEPISLENLTSSNYITFIERDMPEDILCPHRNDGISFNNTMFDERSTLSIGAFMDADDQCRVTSDKINLTGRFTFLPWYEDDGTKLLHLGAGYTFRTAKEAHYAGKPEAHLAPDFLDTGVISVNHVNLVDLEAAVVYGPFSMQGEFLESFVDQKDGPSDTHFEGGYVQMSYFLTGEHKNYDTGEAVFGSITPKRNFSIKEWAPGAWEIGARYSYLDLNDNDIKGGILSDVTLGINWYLNPNMRVMLNYIHAHSNGKGNADIGTMRFQVNY